MTWENPFFLRSRGDASDDDDNVLAQSKNNQRLFSWRGMNILAGTPDHYGAVINLNFDFVKYLDTLASGNHTVLRVWSGVYREVNASQFGIHHNTLNPMPGRYVAPWERSTECCYSDGGNKFDLSKFSSAYMNRLEAFISAAAERSIAVELTLFSSMYPGTDTQWDASPLNAENNVNDVEAASAASWYDLNNTKLLAFQRSLVMHLITKLNRHPNIYFEIAILQPWVLL